MVSKSWPRSGPESRVNFVNNSAHVCEQLLTNVSTDRLSPLFVPVDFVDILFTNVYATPGFFGGGVSLFFRCAAPTPDSVAFD